MPESTAITTTKPQRTLTTDLRARYEGTFLEAQVAKFRAVADPLDCLEELALARALLAHMLTSYEQQNEWARLWAEQQNPDRPPPTRWLYPDDLLKFIEVIGKCAERVQTLRSLDTLSRAEMRHLIWQMGRDVESVVQQTDGSAPHWQERLLRGIRDKWRAIWV